MTNKRTPDKAAKVCGAIIATLTVPAIITLLSVNVPQTPVPITPDLTPYGYTWSLSIFLIPCFVIATWFLRHPDYLFQRKAFWISIAILVPIGFFLDIFFASTFFTFENKAAVLGIEIPVFGGYAPLEEFIFYLSGFIAILLTYVWCDEFWLSAYNVPDYDSETKDTDKIIKFYPQSLIVGLVLFAVALTFNKFFGQPDSFPGYFAFILVVSIVPSMFLFPTARYFINWRALSFTFLLLIFVALFWESTLGIPYQWWGYNDKQMMGIFIDAWANLPIECVIVWMAATYTTVITYETVKIFIALKKHQQHALFG
jgi:hypothetical protein